MPLLLILISLIFSIALIPATQNSPSVVAQAQENPLKMSIRPLYGGFYQDGRWTAVEITVENQADQIWNGEVRAALPVNANSADSTFAKQVSIGAKSTERFFLYLLPIQRPNSPVPIILYDNNQREVARENLRLQLYASSDYLIGMLADDNVALSFPRLNTLTVRASSFRPVPFKLEPKDLTDKPEAIDAFNAIIVHDLSPDKITDAQRRSLLAWTTAGGQLIFAGTPKLSGNMLAITSDTLTNILPVQLNGQETIEELSLKGSNPENAFLIDFPQTSNFNRLIPTRNAFTSIQQYKSNLAPVMVTRPFGRGSISVLAVDPLSPEFSTGTFLRQWWSLIIDNGLPILDYSWINQNLFSQNGISNILLNLPAPNQPSPLLFLLTIGIYIVLVVPVTYFGLRRVGRTELAWAVIPGLSIVFGLSMVWVVSMLPVGDVYLSRINLVMATDDEIPVNVESFVLIASANEDPYKLTIKSRNVLVRPQFLTASNPSQNSALPPDVIIQNEAAGNIVLQSTSIGRGRLQVFGTEGSQNLSTPFETRLQVQEDDIIAGTIINKSQITVREAVLVFGDNYLPLGDWLPGEEKRVNFPLKLKTNFIPRTNIDPALFRAPTSVASLVNGTPTPIATFTPLPTPGTTFNPGDNATNQSQFSNVKWMIFNSSYLNGRFSSAYRVNNLQLTGWLDEGVINNPMNIAEQRTVQQDLTFLIKPLPLSFVSENGRVSVPPHTLIADRLVDMSRSTLGGYNLGNNQQMVLQYRLPGELSNPKFQLTTLSVLLNSYREQDRRSIVPPNIWRGRWADPVEAGTFQNNPRVEVWNWETSNWELVISQGDNRPRIDFARPDLGAFLAPDSGYIRVRLSVSNETIFLGQVNIGVKGNYQP